MGFQEKGVSYRASPKAFLGNYLLAGGLLFLSFLLGSRLGIEFVLEPSGFMQVMGDAVYMGIWGAAGFLIFECLLEVWVRKYVLGQQEIVEIEGIISKKRTIIPYQGVSEVKVSRGLLPRILDYGTVEVLGLRESGEIIMKKVSAPEEVQRIIQHRVKSSMSSKPVPAKKRTVQDEDEDELDYSGAQ